MKHAPEALYMYVKAKKRKPSEAPPEDWRDARNDDLMDEQLVPDPEPEPPQLDLFR